MNKLNLEEREKDKNINRKVITVLDGDESVKLPKLTKYKAIIIAPFLQFCTDKHKDELDCFFAENEAASETEKVEKSV